MYAYILAALLGYCVWKCILAANEWKLKRDNVSHLPVHPYNHWLLGLFHKVITLNDFLTLLQEYVERERPRMFTVWLLFLYPSIVPIHPSTLKPFLQASNVPKNHGLGGPYRMMKPWIGDGLLVSGGRKWERNRRLLTPAFHFDILRPYVAVFNKVAALFLDRIGSRSDGQSFDVFPYVSRATLDTMLRCTVSFTDDTVQNADNHHPYVEAISILEENLVYRCMTPILYIDWIYKLTSGGRQFQKACNYVHSFSDRIIAARRKALADNPDAVQKRYLDFLDTLITAQDSKGMGLTDMEIRDEVDTFMFEGHDTTASAISWALYALAEYPDMQQKMRQEVTDVLDGRTCVEPDDLQNLVYTTCFIKESLRMRAAVPVTTRKLCEPLTHNGKTYMPGQVIDIHYHVMNHNPDIWDNHNEFQPEKFLPENSEHRDPFAFTPFSAGQRNCIGQHFAMNEIKVILARTLLRFHVRLDPARPAIEWPLVTMKSKDGIHLFFDPV